MQLFNLEITKWSINIETYFGDLYLMHRAWLTVLGVVVVLRVAKLIRKRLNERAELNLLSDPTIWSN
jgi:hypothetical protein